MSQAIKLPETIEIVAANNGKEALEIVQKDIMDQNREYSSFPLILMDCQMPVMDGYQAT